MTPMNPELERAAELAAEYLGALDERPVSHEPDPEELRARLQKELTDEGLPGLEVLEELCADTAEGLLHTQSARFFGWVIGGALPVSIAADWLASTWDQNAAAYACSPSASVVEDVVASWVKELLGLPTRASYAFVTGCQMAHVTALAAARQRMLADRGWSVEEEGLAGSPPIRVLAGTHHETLVRALRMLGIGTRALVPVATEEDGTLDVADLEARLAEDGEAPTIVALAAGDLNRGCFDPFEAACDVAHAHGAWVHVDGAFGLWAAASQRLRHHVRGVEKADSWATDAHKWLNVPYDSGLAFVADTEAHRAALSIGVGYRIEVPGVRDQIEWNPEWSRRARGFPLYAALRTLGRDGVARMIEGSCDRARELVDLLSQLPGVEVLAEPLINQGLVRFLDPAGEHDARTEELIRRINVSGEAWFGPTTWNGMRVMRVSVSNFRTSAEDVERAARAVAGVLSDFAG